MTSQKIQECQLKTIEQTITDYLSKTAAAAGSELTITPQTRLLDADILDSIALVGLVQFLESEFGLEIADHDLVPELFETPTSIADYVAMRLAPSPSALAVA
jgi:acyl carrier protein